MPTTTNQFLELARRGAEHRYGELQQKLNALVAHFPDLRTLNAAPTLQSHTASVDATALRPRTMSAAARRRISESQKKRWAAQKATQHQAQATSAERNATASRGSGMSPAARRAVSERMKKYWAERPKAKGRKTA